MGTKEIIVNVIFGLLGLFFLKWGYNTAKWIYDTFGHSWFVAFIAVSGPMSVVFWILLYVRAVIL